MKKFLLLATTLATAQYTFGLGGLVDSALNVADSAVHTAANVTEDVVDGTRNAVRPILHDHYHGRPIKTTVYRQTRPNFRTFDEPVVVEKTVTVYE